MTERKQATNAAQKEMHKIIPDGTTARVIRVNTDTDTYEVVCPGDGGTEEGFGISGKASEWFRNYALRGYVREEDLEPYLLFTERHAMREWGMKNGGETVLKFHRRVGGKFRAASLEIIPDGEFSDERPFVLAVIRDL